MKLRRATVADADKILEIYEPFILNTRITFEYAVPSRENFRQRVEKIIEKYPYLICEKNSETVGYCYGSRFMERAAFGWDAELSVYIRRDCQGLGIGKALYGSVIDILKLMNIRNIYGLIAYPNPASVRLHDYYGFRLQGTLRKTGYKFGEWIDLMYYVLRIGGDGAASDVKYISEIDDKFIDKILNKFEKHLNKNGD